MPRPPPKRHKSLAGIKTEPALGKPGLPFDIKGLPAAPDWIFGMPYTPPVHKPQGLPLSTPWLQASRSTSAFHTGPPIAAPPCRRPEPAPATAPVFPAVPSNDSDDEIQLHRFRRDEPKAAPPQEATPPRRMPKPTPAVPEPAPLPLPPSTSKIQTPGGHGHETNESPPPPSPEPSFPARHEKTSNGASPPAKPARGLNIPFDNG